MTADQRLWAAAIALEEVLGERALEWVAKSTHEFSLDGDEVAVQWTREMWSRLKQLADMRATH